MVVDNTTTRLRERLVPFPLSFNRLYCGRLTATIIKSDDFERKLKIYQMGILSPVPVFQVLGPCPCWLGAGSYTLPNIPRGEREFTIMSEVNKLIKQSNQAN